MTDERPLDITPDERYLLSCIRRRPALYLWNKSFKAFLGYIMGYQHALAKAKFPLSGHTLLPDGMHEFAAEKYLGGVENMGVCGWMSCIEKYQPDDKKALDEFFVFLDEYLVHLGYEPIPDWDAVYGKKTTTEVQDA